MTQRSKLLLFCALSTFVMVSFLAAGPRSEPVLPLGEAPLATDTPQTPPTPDPTFTSVPPRDRVYAYAPAVFQYDKLTATPTLPPTATPRESPTPGPTDTPAEPSGRIYVYAPAVFQYDKLTATPTPPPTATPRESPTPGPTETPAEP